MMSFIKTTNQIALKARHSFYMHKNSPVATKKCTIIGTVIGAILLKWGDNRENSNASCKYSGPPLGLRIDQCKILLWS